MKVVVVTCLWRRHQLSGRVLARFAAAQKNLRDVVDLDFVAVGSEKDVSAELAQQHGWQYVEFANRPLGAKWNAALGRAREMEADAILVVGSDDWLSDGLIKHQVEALERGVQVAEIRDVYLLCGRTLECRRFGPTGVGRTVHRTILDKLDWSLWGPGTNCRLDAFMNKRLRAVGVESRESCYMSDVEGGSMVDVKAGTNIRGFSGFSRRGEPVLWTKALAPFADDEVDALLAVLPYSTELERTAL